jgi:hypothetical protein
MVAGGECSARCDGGCRRGSGREGERRGDRGAWVVSDGERSARCDPVGRRRRMGAKGECGGDLGVWGVGGGRWRALALGVTVGVIEGWRGGERRGDLGRGWWPVAGVRRGVTAGVAEGLGVKRLAGFGLPPPGGRWRASRGPGAWGGVRWRALGAVRPVGRHRRMGTKGQCRGDLGVWGAGGGRRRALGPVRGRCHRGVGVRANVAGLGCPGCGWWRWRVFGAV